MSAKNGKLPKMFVDPSARGVIRWEGGDSMAGILAGEKAALIVRAVNSHADLLAALQALTATTRTFRNVPKNQQEWTPIDDEALDAAFAAIAKATS